MQVILLDKVANLGSLGDQVNVKAGYARNFLVPQGKAVPATKKNVEFFEEMTQGHAKKQNAGTRPALRREQSKKLLSYYVNNQFSEHFAVNLEVNFVLTSGTQTKCSLNWLLT